MDHAMLNLNPSFWPMQGKTYLRKQETALLQASGGGYAAPASMWARILQKSCRTSLSGPLASMVSTAMSNCSAPSQKCLQCGSCLLFQVCSKVHQCQGMQSGTCRPVHRQYAGFANLQYPSTLSTLKSSVRKCCCPPRSIVYKMSTMKPDDSFSYRTVSTDSKMTAIGFVAAELCLTLLSSKACTGWQSGRLAVTCISD